jgi:hypothetical protein
MKKSNENAILWGLIERIGIIIVLGGALTLIIPSLMGMQSNLTLLAGASILIIGAIAHIIVTMLSIDNTKTCTKAEMSEVVPAAKAEEEFKNVQKAEEPTVAEITEEPAAEKAEEVTEEPVAEKAIKLEK